MKRFALAAGLGLALCAGTPAYAQSHYPDHAIKVLLPLRAGSTAWFIGRVYAEAWKQELGVPVVIEPRPGAQGAIAAMELERAKPDGYTAGYMLKTMIAKNKKYDALRFEYSTYLAEGEMYLTVPASSNVTDLAGLIRENPYLYGAVSVGARLAGEQFVEAAGLTSGLYPSSAQTARQDLIVGRVGFAFLFSADIRLGVKEHQVRPLAIIAPERSKYFPQVPTIAEAMAAAGKVPYSVTPAFTAIAFPPGTPKHILRRFSEATCKAAANREVQARLAGIWATSKCSAPEAMRALAEQSYAEMMAVELRDERAAK